MSNFNNGNNGVNANAAGPSAAPAGPSGLNIRNNGVNANAAGPSVAPAGPRRRRNYRRNRGRAVPSPLRRGQNIELIDVPVVYENEVNNAMVVADAPRGPGEVNNAIEVDDAPIGPVQTNNAIVVHDASIGQEQLNNAIVAVDVPIGPEQLDVAVVAQDPPNDQGEDNPAVEEVQELPSYWHEFMTAGHVEQVTEELQADLPLDERMKGWVIRELQCKGKTPEKKRNDPNYIHMKSDKICRAWTEVVDYVVHNIAPTRTPRREEERRPKANNRFNLFIVGFVEINSKVVYYANNRIAVSNTKRKRTRQIGPIPPGFTHILYDFEPIQPVG